MVELSTFVNFLAPLQWFVAVVFVPLVCLQFCNKQSVFCRWCAMLSGYGVQVGFFLLLDDVGFKPSLLILIASVAAYFWISTTVALWPSKTEAKTPLELSNPADANPTNAA